MYERLSRLTSTQLWRKGMKNYVWTCMENSHESEWNFFQRVSRQMRNLLNKLANFHMGNVSLEICYFPATWIELICNFYNPNMIFILLLPHSGIMQVRKICSKFLSWDIVIKNQWLIGFIIKIAWIENNEHLRVEQASGKRM